MAILENAFLGWNKNIKNEMKQNEMKQKKGSGKMKTTFLCKCTCTLYEYKSTARKKIFLLSFIVVCHHNFSTTCCYNFRKLSWILHKKERRRKRKICMYCTHMSKLLYNYNIVMLLAWPG